MRDDVTPLALTAFGRSWRRAMRALSRSSRLPHRTEDRKPRRWVTGGALSAIAIVLGLITPGTVGSGALAASPAPAVPSPTAQGRGIILAEPGVVFVLTSFSV